MGASYCISSALSAPRTCALFVLAFAAPTASLTTAGIVLFRQRTARCHVHAALRAGKTLPTPLLEQLGIVGKRGAVCFVDDDRAWSSFKVLSGYTDRANDFAARSCTVVVVRPPDGADDTLADRFPAVSFLCDEKNALRKGIWEGEEPTRAGCLIDAQGVVQSALADAADPFSYAAAAASTLREMDAPPPPPTPSELREQRAAQETAVNRATRDELLTQQLAEKSAWERETRQAGRDYAGANRKALWDNTVGLFSRGGRDKAQAEMAREAAASEAARAEEAAAKAAAEEAAAKAKEAKAFSAGERATERGDVSAAEAALADATLAAQQAASARADTLAARREVRDKLQRKATLSVQVAEAAESRATAAQVAAAAAVAEAERARAAAQEALAEVEAVEEEIMRANAAAAMGMMTAGDDPPPTRGKGADE